jgi:hypothetical protein
MDRISEERNQLYIQCSPLEDRFYKRRNCRNIERSHDILDPQYNTWDKVE